MLENVSEAQISNFFLGGMLPDPPRNLRVFSLFAYSKAFNALIYLKLMENIALCYGKESPIKGCYEGLETILHYHWNQSINIPLQTIQNKYTSTF